MIVNESVATTQGFVRRSFGLMITVASVVLAQVLPAPGMRSWGPVIALWVCGVSYAVSRFRERVTMFVFLMSFAFFLLMKPILIVYAHYDGLGWTPEIQRHLVLVLSLGLTGLYVGYWISLRVFRRYRPPRPRGSWWPAFTKRLGSVSLIAFVLSLPFSVLHLVTNLRTASEFGYTGLYMGSGGAFASVAAYGNVANMVALCLFLATLPSRRKTWVVLIVATLPRALLLLTGDRGDIGTFLLMIFIYLVFRTGVPGNQIIGPRDLRMLSGLLLVAIIPLFMFVGIERGVGAGHSTVIDFLYGQGASLNVIEYGKSFAGMIPDGDYMLLFADQGLFRLFFGGTGGGLAGNSVEYALSGTSFSHSLSYVVLGDSYLGGRGLGTSFLAEAYADWGYFGVVFVGLVYGSLMCWIDRFPAQSVIMNALRLVVLPAVLFAPRGSATAFLADLLSPVTIVVLFGVWALARAAKSDADGATYVVSEGTSDPGGCMGPR